MYLNGIISKLVTEFACDSLQQWREEVGQFLITLHLIAFFIIQLTFFADVHISLTGKNVHAKFYLADNSAVDIISDNMGDLVNQLKDRGFTLTDEVMKREEKQTNKVVEEVFESDKEQSVKRYTFDVRM